MTETSEAVPEEARHELETAISEALTRAWCMAVTYAAVNLVSEGVPLGYPEARPETAKLLAAVDAWSAADASAVVIEADHQRAVIRQGEKVLGVIGGRWDGGIVVYASLEAWDMSGGEGE